MRVQSARERGSGEGLGRGARERGSGEGLDDELAAGDRPIQRAFGGGPELAIQ
jgi:hypothetical protein